LVWHGQATCEDTAGAVCEDQANGVARHQGADRPGNLYTALEQIGTNDDNGEFNLLSAYLIAPAALINHFRCSS
jgi:hypothetical protein